MKKRILFIDDSRAQLELYRQQMEAGFEVETASTYEQAMAFLSVRLPDLVIVDMVMPRVDGLEFLDILKSTKSFMGIPVVMVSSENDPNIVRQAFVKGASDFVRKPYDAEELILRTNRILSSTHKVPSPKEAEVSQFFSARSLMIQALSDLSGTRDNDTGYHLHNIERYTGILALEVARAGLYEGQMSDSLLESIGEISVLHDIGKVGIPDSILKKPGPLTAEEFEVMKTHTTLGAETIRRVQEKFPFYGFLETARQIALYHHEKWNGKGYPTRLGGEEIPLAARIVAVVDVFDALTSKRVYKGSIAVDEALKIMVADRGQHFDPGLIDLFVANVDHFEVVTPPTS
jgi:putative two-component system response regulator